MTYNPDYERSKLPGAGLGDYQSSYDNKPISGKWLLITLAFIVVLFGALAIFSGGAPVTVNEDGTTGATQAPAVVPEPTVPATPTE